MPPSVDELNESIPQYEFVDLIGAGGMGAVYKARQPTLDRFVAVKILPPIPDDEMGFTERFRREARAMAKLSHPHIVAVYDFGETEEGELYFVMEYVEGADLHRLIQDGQLTNKHFFSWIPQICGALQYAHKNGVIHRDIKPANVLIDTAGRVKIADFGLAKRTGADQPLTALTVANVSMGTPDYAAPEQLEGGKPVDWRADIYSVGVLMYHMLTGSVPRGAFPMPTEKVPELDPRIDDVVMKAIQSNPDNRFQNADEITARLTEISSTPPPEVKKIARLWSAIPEKYRNPWILAAAAGVVLLAVTATSFQFFLTNAVNERAEIAEVEKAQETEPAPIPKPKPKPPVAVNGAIETETPAPKKETPAPAPKKEKAPAEKRKGPAGEPKPAMARAEKPALKTVEKPVKPAADDPDAPAGQRPSARHGTAAKGGPLALFKSKLGSRLRPEAFRKTASGLLLISRNGQELPAAPLAEAPADLPPLVKLVIGQGPRQTGAASPFAIGLHPDGALSAWGDNSEGQLDIPAAASGIVDIAAGADHALALKSDGTVLGWGAADAGQTEIPPGLTGVAGLAAGHEFSVALLKDGTVATWGSAPQFAPPADLTGVKAIAAGYEHVLCLKEDGTIATWGDNTFGQLDAPEISNAKAIACTYGSSLALGEDGRLLAWGTSRQKEFSPEGALASLAASGDTVIVRDEQKRLLMLPPHGRTPAAFPFLRQFPASVEIVCSEDILFVFHPHRSKVREGAAGLTVNPGDAGSVDLAVEPMPDPPSLPDTEAGRRIAELQKQYGEAYLEKVSLPYEESVTQLNEFYLNALEKKQAEAAAANHLEEAVAFRTEADQMRAGNPLPESDVANLEFSLLDLRSKYREQIETFKETRDAAEADLLEKYDGALQAMQDEFTQEQKLDDALEVKSFRERRK